jgi:sugar phosphate permease
MILIAYLFFIVTSLFISIPIAWLLDFSWLGFILLFYIVLIFKCLLFSILYIEQRKKKKEENDE